MKTQAIHLRKGQIMISHPSIIADVKVWNGSFTHRSTLGTIAFISICVDTPFAVVVFPCSGYLLGRMREQPLQEVVGKRLYKHPKAPRGQWYAQLIVSVLFTLCNPELTQAAAPNILYVKWSLYHLGNPCFFLIVCQTNGCWTHVLLDIQLG